MGNLTILALRGALAVVLAGTVFVQVVMVPLLAVDLDQPEGVAVASLHLPVQGLVALGIIALGFVTVQVTLVCVWRLLTMVRRDTVFSEAAFRYVHVVIGAVAAASALTFALAVTLAPGEAVPPGMVLLVCGASVAIAAVALLVLVLRMLLAQAVARDVEAHHLQAELDEVI